MLYREMRRFVEPDLQQVETTIAGHLDTDVPFIEETSRYVLSSGGKRIRPALLILSARLCGGAGQRMYDLSTVIEFIHTATLLHDDVMDNADLRRGNPTVPFPVGQRNLHPSSAIISTPRQCRWPWPTRITW